MSHERASIVEAWTERQTRPKAAPTRPARSTRRRGTPSPSSSSATTGSTGAAGVSAITPSAERRGSAIREAKEERVRTGRAHAALVLDENGVAQGWCQYGSPEELPGIKHKREYDKDAPPRPDWRITCIFVDKRHRGLGITRAGLEGALDQIARLGGGLVEAIPEVTAGARRTAASSSARRSSSSSSTASPRGRRVGKHAWIVSRDIDPA